MILGWSSSKIVSVSAVLYPRWPPLLKIFLQMAKNCSILSQKVPTFELYKHNDELFNIYYGIFYELWTFAYFDRLCKLEKRGMKFKKNLLWNYWANLNQTLLKWFLGGPLPKLCFSAVLYPRWPPLLKIEISSYGKNCSILSQKVPTFELYKHNDELFNIYYGIFYELWTFAYFDRLCKLEKRGMKFKKNLLWNYWANLNQTWNDPWVVPFQNVSALYPRWPPLLKIEISSNGQKLLYFKPESAQIWTV